MELKEVDHFIYVKVLDDDNVEVHVASLCSDERPACLKFHTLKVGNPRNELEMFFDIESHERDIPYFNHKMKIQNSTRVVDHKDDIVSILKTIPGTFGVWGLFQFEYFDPILDSVVDIEPLVEKALKQFRFVGSIIKTISDLYLEILPKFEWDCRNSAWRYFFAKTKSLREIEYFAFYETGKNDNVYIAKTGLHFTPCLHICNVHMTNVYKKPYPELRALTNTSTDTRHLVPLNWRMKIANSWKYVRSKSEMETFLRQVDATFGVWGKEQYGYFSRFLDNVVDVEPLIMYQVTKLEMDDKDKQLKSYFTNVGELFLEILRKRTRNSDIYFEEEGQKQFREWIEKEGWGAFFRNPMICRTMSELLNESLPSV